MERLRIHMRGVFPDMDCLQEIYVHSLHTWTLYKKYTFPRQEAFGHRLCPLGVTHWQIFPGLTVIFFTNISAKDGYTFVQDATKGVIILTESTVNKLKIPDAAIVDERPNNIIHISK